MKRPRLPMVLTKPMPPAAAVPARKVEGRLKNGPL